MTSAVDLLSPASFAAGHPFDQYSWLRDNDPVHWHDEPGGTGFWAVTRYDDVKAVSRDTAVFSSSPTIMIPHSEGLEIGDHTMMLMMDPPRHTRYRKLVSPRFVRPAALRMREGIERLATEIVDGVVDRDEFDLVEDVAGLLPSYVIAELIGIPRDDGVALYRLTEAIHAAPESLPEGAALGAVIEMLTYAQRVWEEKTAT
ncbi:MAG TPA: cytochrome P450, partial [Mycobacteriales bacterium]|nr:cytochrome P450 [Mycobacteriales bacterium]